MPQTAFAFAVDSDEHKNNKDFLDIPSQAAFA
jgi:hypothetical protein